MAKLKLGAIADDKPVKLTVDLPGNIHRDLAAYADLLARETGQPIADPSKLVAPMLARFMATDRVFAKVRRRHHTEGAGVCTEKLQEYARARSVLSSLERPE